MAWLNYVFAPLILVLGLFILAKSAHLVISAIVRVGHNLRLSQFVTGFVILGVATSTPEIFVGIQSALAGSPQLSLGNLWGANIVLLTLLSGITAIANKGVDVKSEFSHSHRLGQMLGLVIAPLLLLVDLRFSRLDGLLLLLLYGGYLVYVYAKRPANSPPVATAHPVNHHLGRTLILTIVGVAGLIISSRVIVTTAVNIAALLQLPQIIIGTVLLSLGTNLPEISVVLEAIRRHHPALVIGDVLGSAATNTLVIAVVSLLTPFPLTNLAVIVATAVAMGLAVGVFWWFSRSQNRLSTSEGWILVGLYTAFLTSQVAALVLQ